MKRRIHWLLLLLIVHCYSAVALADTPEQFNGTWLLDTAASEEAILRNPPYKEAKRFVMVTMLGISYLEIDGEFASIGVFANPNKSKFRLQSNDGSRAKYVSEDAPGGRHETMTVSTVGNQYINIELSNIPPTRHFLWKRGTLDPQKTRPDHFKPEIASWAGSLQRIMKVLYAPPNPSINLDAAR